MVSASRAAAAIASLVWVAGCSAIAGLDSIHEQACAPNCGDDGSALDGTGPDGSSEASADVTVDTSPPSSDAPSGIDSPSDDGTFEDTSVPPTDSSTGDGPATDGSPRDSAPSDAPLSSDAPFDSGCGPLNTVTNCSACGDHCSTNSSETSSSCSGSPNGAGATCSYMCATGYLDCNGIAGTNPPNLDGCECQAPGATASQCCSGGCPVSHTDGLVGGGYPPNPTFYDCVPTGTMNSQLAQDACNNYVSSPLIGAMPCQGYSETTGGPIDGWCGGGDQGDCICWVFAGTPGDIGTVFDAFANGEPDPTQCYYGASTVKFH